MKDYLHKLDFEVRDHECDLQGIVNNSIYLNYLEHARHKCLNALGLDFAALTAQGVYLIVTRAEVDYKTPLRPNDHFVVCSNLERVSRLRFAFVQDIYRMPDEVVCINARITGSSMNSSGRPMVPREVEILLATHAKPTPGAQT